MAPFRFGIVAGQAASGAEWKETAARAEAAGYSSLLLPDTPGPVLSPFSALATAAAVTTKLKVGNWVLAADFRNPVLLAREAATLALLSDNRLELGFGAGRGDNDYASLGLGQPASGGVRLSRLDEVLQIVTRLLAGETVTYEGAHYTIRNASIYPRPTARVPILMAASGPRAIQLAGRCADIVALAAGSREHFLQQRQTLQAAAKDRFSSIQLASIVWLMPEGDPAAAEAARAIVRRLSGTDVDTLIASRAPTALAGSHQSMIDELQERRETLGLSYVVVGAQTAEWFKPVVARLAGT
jgi:probable F420-dependent oxidoreductase